MWTTTYGERVVFLPEVLKFDAASVAARIAELSILETTAAYFIKDGIALPVLGEVYIGAVQDVENAARTCRDHALEHGAEAAAALLRRLVKPERPLSYSDLQLELRNLAETIQRDLLRAAAIRIPREFAADVDNDALFGQAVADAFPSARADLRDAGNARAVGLNTACVFHLMRAVEVALRALVEERQVGAPKAMIDYAQWEELIGAIEKSVVTTIQQWRKSPEKSAALEFYRSAIAGFYAFKDVFRNHVMHSRSAYGPEVARVVMEQVREFLRVLAGHLDESGSPISWPEPPTLAPP
ncbi:MAG: hypothetical protein ACXW5U_32040 [Thermoanaerobaculia bacterium]